MTWEATVFERRIGDKKAIVWFSPVSEWTVEVWEKGKTVKASQHHRTKTEATDVAEALMGGPFCDGCDGKMTPAFVVYRDGLRFCSHRCIP